jgi:O-antigen ligase
LSKSDFKYKLNYYTLLILAFVIPLHKEFAAPFIALFFITSLINCKPKAELLTSAKILLPIVLLIISLISLLYSTDISSGFSKIETKLSWLIFPISFFFSNLNFKKITPKILVSFIEGCIVAAIISVINATIFLYYSGSAEYFFYGNFGVFHHTSYTGMYYSFALIIIYYFALKPSKKFHLSRTLNFLLIVFFSVCIALLVSRTAIFTLLIIHVFALSFWIFHHKKLLLGSMAVLSILITFFALLYASPTFNSRVKGAFDVDKSNQNSSTNTRFNLWKLNLEIAFEHPIIGVGEGDVQEIQEIKYFESNNSELKNHFLNAHNQFIQTWIATGLIGLICLLSILVAVATKSWENNFIIGSFFIVLVLINFVTEAMLETQSGVIFIAFFTCLFWTKLSLQPKEKLAVQIEKDTSKTILN